MTDPAAALRRAEVTAAEARRRLDATVAALQVRLDPKVLAQDAKDVGTAAALSGVDTAKRNPGVLAGIAAVAGLFLIRGRIAATLRRRRARRPVPAAPRSSPSLSEDAS